MSAKDDFINGLKSQLDQVNEGIDSLSKKAQNAQSKSKEQLQSQIANLKQKRDDAAAKIKEIGNASGDAWQNMQDGTRKMVSSLKDSLSKTMDNIKEWLG